MTSFYFKPVDPLIEALVAAAARGVRIEVHHSLRAALPWLVIIAVVNSAISLFYYMRVVVAMYMRDVPSGGIATSPSFALNIALLLAAAGTLLLGIFPGPILELARASAAVVGG